MRSLNSVFNGKYFVCSLLRILPYGGIMAAVIAFFDALFFGLSNVLAVKSGLAPSSLSGCAPFFMIVFPVLLSLALYNFLHKQKKSDFYGAVPVSRMSLFLTNIAVGVTLIAGILLINAASMAVIIKISYPGAAAAFQAYLYSFFSMLAGWLAVFGIASFCATLSGGIVSTLLLTVIILYIPTAFAIIFQFPIINAVSASSYIAGDIISINPLYNKLFLFPSFYSDMGFLSLAFGGSSVNEYTQIWRIAYNFILFLLFTAGGMISMRFRPFETAGRPFVKEILTDVSLALLFFPFAFFSLYFINETFIITGMVIVLFFVAAIIVRKGFGKIWRSAISFAVCAILAVSAYFILDSIRNYNNEIRPYVVKENISDIEKAEIYMAPLDVVGEKCIPVEIPGDVFRDIISVSSYESATDFLYNAQNEKIVLQTNEGRTYSVELSVNNAGKEILYSYIEKNPELVSKLESIAKRPILCTSVVAAEKGVRIKALDGEKLERLISERQGLTISERYARVKDFESMFNLNYSDTLLDILVNNYMSVFNSYTGVINYRYIAGNYFYDCCSFSDIEMDVETVRKIEDVLNKGIENWKDASLIFFDASYIGDKRFDNELQNEMYVSSISSALESYSYQIFEDIKNAESRYDNVDELICLNLTLQMRGKMSPVNVALFVDYNDFIEKYVDMFLDDISQRFNSFSDSLKGCDIVKETPGEDKEHYIISDAEGLINFITENPDIVISYKNTEVFLTYGGYRISWIPEVCLKADPQIEKYIEPIDESYYSSEKG